jgi:pimeloyl-ACP methyl ester carboxylesterase
MRFSPSTRRAENEDLCAWYPFASTLVRMGYRVLVYDYYSADPATAAVAAARRLARVGAARVFLVGASLGAKASIVAASRHPDLVAGVVSLSAELVLDGETIEPYARRLASPVLFVVARGDGFANGATPVLYRDSPSSKKRLLVVSGAAHGVDLLEGSTGVRVRAAILSFLASHT